MKQPSQRTRRQTGQTLIIALIVMGVLLTLGFIFLGLIDQNIVNSGTYQNRTIASDLAQDGIRYAHDQMVHGVLGADWRGPYTAPAAANGQPNFTSDPDALYLRPPATDTAGNPISFNPNDPTQVDLGGPDGLGFYSRVNFGNGRALIRVRYAPSDANIFSTIPNGPLVNPGLARTYIIIEAVGRPGAINPNDPTTALGGGTPVQFQGFANSAALQTAIQAMKTAEAKVPTSKKEIAFDSIGIIESALYISNKDQVSRPADLGIPNDFGATTVANNGGTPTVVPVQVPMVIGAPQALLNFGTPPTPTLQAINLGGSVYSNADLRINGNLIVNLNKTLGDQIDVNGTINAADANSQLTVFRASWQKARGGLPAGWYGGYPATQPVGTSAVLAGTNINSRGNFNTLGGVIRDGLASTDALGFSRGVPRKSPPLIEEVDPSTGEGRYLSLTRDSGSIVGSGNSGRFGYGAGVYVDNFDDYQLAAGAANQLADGTTSSLVHDWLNPNNGQDFNSGWQGPYYSPVAAIVHLTSDGFTITRDNPRGDTYGTWRNPDGTLNAGGYATLRYRLGKGSDGLVHIVNGLTPGIGDINGTAINFNLGPVFNGVLYFEGNVRVRGVIPTDVQLTLVSNHTVYVDGSITRGVVGSDVATDKARGVLLDRPSRSSLMIMANEYVALNTTQFFGPEGGSVSPVHSDSTDGIVPIQLSDQTGNTSTLDLSLDELLNPSPIVATSPATNPLIPSSWQPYAANYTAPGSTTLIPSFMLFSHAYDGTNGSASFISMEVNPQLPGSSYLFPLLSNNAATNALTNNGTTSYTEPGYTVPGFASVYGLGVQTWQRYAKFESVGFPLITANMTRNPGGLTITGTTANGPGTYSLGLEATNDLHLILNQSFNYVASQSYDLGRFAVVPADVRIEASMYAENGSFFVIPGPSFNPNPNDSRVNYDNLIASYESQGLSLANAQAAADQFRLNNYGSFPEAPFYGEPLDVKVSIYGAVSENMPPTASEQSDYLRRWGWIPTTLGSSGVSIPASHFTNVATTAAAVPNIIINYDPTLATGRAGGFASNNSQADPYLRYDNFGRPLPPMPRLPVSPNLAYFGEEKP